MLLVVLGVALFLSACGADDGGPDGDGGPGSGGVQVADGRFEGRFSITEVTLGGEALALAAGPLLDIDTEFGTLMVEPGCNTYFGSFTLAEDGTASFSVPGVTGRNCGDFEAQEEAIVRALRQIDRWAVDGDGFRFTGPGAEVTISR